MTLRGVVRGIVPEGDVRHVCVGVGEMYATSAGIDQVIVALRG